MNETIIEPSKARPDFTRDILEKPTISIISPVHNEEGGLRELYERVRQVMDTLDQVWELVLVNDGSRDNSEQEIASLSTLFHRKGTKSGD